MVGTALAAPVSFALADGGGAGWGVADVAVADPVLVAGAGATRGGADDATAGRGCATCTGVGAGAGAAAVIGADGLWSNPLILYAIDPPAPIITTRARRSNNPRPRRLGLAGGAALA
ncbi:MAG: hypothetical protein B7X48_04105 [Acidiphilium sp. 34-60-192]|nr:MAG: hypothetical protein B7X48_04105 [Acidiphilium sp. 34-60-192]